MSQVGLRAGLMGAVAALVISFLSLVPLIGGCLVWLFSLALWSVLGLLVARWLPAPADEEQIAVAGAMAGLIAGLVGGLLGILLAPLGLALLGGTEGVLRLLPAGLFRLYQDAGIAPEVLYSPSGVLLGATFSCTLMLVFSTVVTAVSALLGAHWWGYEPLELWEEEPGPYLLEW